MSKPWLSETDKEVSSFHPVCERALQEALVMLSLDDKYQVQHHRYVGNLEMDLVISNKISKKIFCVIEVKRTIPAVYSSRYQYQTMNYVQLLRDVEKETNYYILTNLECSCLFLYSSNRPNVFDQMIQPGYIFNHRFEDVDESVFREDLAIHFKEIIAKILNQDTNYLLSFSNFATIVRESMPSLLSWNSSLAFMFYEYIRGSFNGIGRRELFDIKQFRNDITAICREASRINFKGIFGLDKSEYSAEYKPNDMVLDDLYKLGQSYKDADLICNVMHQVISSDHTHEGEVPTDIELAQTLLSLVKAYIPEIDSDYNITDPAAGSGTLLSAAALAFPTLKPSQIHANDINEKLLQLLSLRLGLNFATTLAKDNSPIVRSCDIANLEKSFFDHTKVIVLNPPYLSAVAEKCAEKKATISSRIYQITGKASITNVGQAPLECPFIELVTNLVKPGTIIACIIPNTHLSALGPSEVVFRRFLLEQFGLSLIFNYPQTNLFNDVVQNTSIIIGKAFEPQKSIKFVQSHCLISEIEQDRITEALSNIREEDYSVELSNGLVGRSVPYIQLNNKVEDGWMYLDQIIGQVHSYINELIISNTSLFCNIEDTAYRRIYRGKVGNSGGSDLLYITSKPGFVDECGLYVKQALKPGMRNADYNKFLVNNGDQLFFDVRNLSSDEVTHVISVYLAKYETQQKQTKKSKSIDEWEAILRKESKNLVPINTVLLPRGTRRFASTYITTKETYLSTNFIAIEMGDFIEAKVLASWMSSIFYQLQLEVYCKNQGGMRKLEKENILRTYVPKIKNLTDEDIESIMTTDIIDFYDLKNPQIRNIDKVWAKIITRNEDPEEYIESAQRYLTILAKNRES